MRVCSFSDNLRITEVCCFVIYSKILNFLKRRSSSNAVYVALLHCFVV